MKVKLVNVETILWTVDSPHNLSSPALPFQHSGASVPSGMHWFIFPSPTIFTPIPQAPSNTTAGMQPLHFYLFPYDSQAANYSSQVKHNLLAFLFS